MVSSRAGALLLCLLSTGCAEEPTENRASVSAPATERTTDMRPALEPAPTTAERSPEDQGAAPPLPGTALSGGFAAATFERAMRQRETEPSAARQSFENGCDRGFVPACLALADMLERGAGVEQDLGGARSAREQACMAGSTAACDALGH